MGFASASSSKVGKQPAESCLCVFDIDRTLTSKQGMQDCTACAALLSRQQWNDLIVDHFLVNVIRSALTYATCHSTFYYIQFTFSIFFWFAIGYCSSKKSLWDALSQEHCPGSRATDEIVDSAYGGGDLVLSELGALGAFAADLGEILFHFILVFVKLHYGMCVFVWFDYIWCGSKPLFKSLIQHLLTDFEGSQCNCFRALLGKQCSTCSIGQELDVGIRGCRESQLNELSKQKWRPKLDDFKSCWYEEDRPDIQYLSRTYLFVYVCGTMKCDRHESKDFRAPFALNATLALSLMETEVVQCPEKERTGPSEMRTKNQVCQDQDTTENSLQMDINGLDSTHTQSQWWCHAWIHNAFDCAKLIAYPRKSWRCDFSPGNWKRGRVMGRAVDNLDTFAAGRLTMWHGFI